MQKETTHKKTVNFHEKQYEAFSFETQYCAAIAGVQSGKTFLGAFWAASQIAAMPKDGVGLICAPSYKILQQATLPKFFKEFPEYAKYFKEHKGQLELPDGRMVYVRSMDDPYGVEGMTIDWAWGDEAGNYKLLAWIVLRSRTAIKKGRILFTTTPYNMGWLYQDFFLPWRNKTDTDLTVVTWASIDNPYFSKEFEEKERGRLRPEEFNRRYLGEFTRMSGLVYGVHTWHIIPREKKLRADITIGGVDWGFTNPAALTVLKYYDGQWKIIDEWYMTGKTTGEIIEQMIAFQKQWGVNRWYADSANPEKILEANTNTGLYVLPYKKEKDALTAGVSYIQQLFNENRIFVFEDLSDTLSEFETYCYPEETKSSRRDEPLPENNHIMDALRYAIHGYAPAKRVRVEVPTLQDKTASLLSRPSNKNQGDANTDYK